MADPHQDFYQRRAEDWLDKSFWPAFSPEDARRMTAFYLRTGRPTPRLLVLGSRAGLFAHVAAGYGCTCVCADFSVGALKLHRAQNPQTYSVCADIRALPFGLSAFDGLWTDSVLTRIPHREFEAAMLELRRVLRPGGLLSARIALGDGEAVENRQHGQLLRAYWREDRFKGVLDMLDYGFSEAEVLDGGRAVLTFRREY